MSRFKDTLFTLSGNGEGLSCGSSPFLFFLPADQKIRHQKNSIGQIPFCSYFLLCNGKHVSWKPKNES
ncbi:MAG: hypothetical protein D3916_06980 [Candidatus Electrothrix sp. MAN1_4]|nr:hypothetical protein [Candidatus Electrothrix sp. MAN1_4]